MLSTYKPQPAELLKQMKLKYTDLEKGPQKGIATVPPEASNTRIGYFTFITPEAVEALKAHLGFDQARSAVIMNSKS